MEKSERKMMDVLKEIQNKLDGKLKWAFFGGLAIAIHKKEFYRDFGDVDIIVEDNEEILRKCFKNLQINCRRGRKRGKIYLDSKEVELLFMVEKNKIQLADGPFIFREITKIKWRGVYFPVIDLESLWEAKLRHIKSLEKQPEKYKEKLKNALFDLKELKALL